jgi:hypothetical protein
MRHVARVAVLLLVLTAALASVVQAAGEVAAWRVARFEPAPGRGSATSVLSVCIATNGAVVGGQPRLQCGAGQAGPGANILSPRVTTTFQGRAPGEVWQLDIFDRGSCNSPSHFVLRLPSLTIAANGKATSRVLFSSAQYRAVAAAFSSPSLTLRVSHRGLHYCTPYLATRGGQ